jgi:hypothetical protein
MKYPYPSGQKAADECIAMIISAAGVDDNPEDEAIELAACKMAASMIVNNVKNKHNIVKDADKLVAYLVDKNDMAMKINPKWFAMFPIHMEIRQRILAATQRYEDDFGVEGVFDVGLVALEDGIIHNMVKTNNFSDLKLFASRTPEVLEYIRYSVELTDYPHPPGLKALEAIMQPNMGCRIIIRDDKNVIVYDKPYHNHTKGVEP